MGKVKKDSVKNIFCGTCMKWMTEIYVTRHLHSKFHFTKKLFSTEQHLQEKQSKIKRARKKQYVVNKNYNGKQKKVKIPVPSEYQQYKIVHGAVEKTRNAEDLDVRDTSNQSLSLTLSSHEVDNDIQSQGKEQVSSDYVSLSQECKTPENEETFSFQGDTLKKCGHNHSSYLLEGCTDIQPTASWETQDREQVKQRLYTSESEETENEQTDQVPQNLLEALGLNWDSEWYENSANETNSFTENGEMPQEIFETQQNNTETSEEFPIEVVSGFFQSS